METTDQCKEEIMDNKQFMDKTFRVETTIKENISDAVGCCEKTDFTDYEQDIGGVDCGNFVPSPNSDCPLLKPTNGHIPNMLESSQAESNIKNAPTPTTDLNERELSSVVPDKTTTIRNNSESTIGNNIKPLLHGTKSEQQCLEGQNNYFMFENNRNSMDNSIREDLTKSKGDMDVVSSGIQKSSPTNGLQADETEIGYNNKGMLIRGDISGSHVLGDRMDLARSLGNTDGLECDKDSEASETLSSNLQSIVVHFMEEKHGVNPVVVPSESEISDDLIDLGQKKSPFKRLQPPMDALPAKSCLRTPTRSFKIFETGNDPLKTKSDNQIAAEVEFVAIMLEHRESCRQKRQSLRKRRPDLTQDEINLPDILARAARPKSKKILRSLTTPFRRVKSLLNGCMRPKAV